MSRLATGVRQVSGDEQERGRTRDVAGSYSVPCAAGADITEWYLVRVGFLTQLSSPADGMCGHVCRKRRAPVLLRGQVRFDMLGHRGGRITDHLQIPPNEMQSRHRARPPGHVRHGPLAHTLLADEVPARAQAGTQGGAEPVLMRPCHVVPRGKQDCIDGKLL